MTAGIVRISRDDLFRKIWQMPRSTLATEYGISTRRLEEICTELEVPFPSRSYWIQRSTGRKVINYRLPIASAKNPLVIELKVKTEKLGLKATSRTKVNPSAPEQPEATDQRVEKLHQIVQKWIEQKAQQILEAKRDRSPYRHGAQPFTALELRRLSNLNSIFKLLEERGASIREGEYRSLFCKIINEEIEFQLREKSIQIKRIPTKDERLWKTPEENGLVTVLEPSGLLVFSITTYLPTHVGLRKSWVEKLEKPMEKMVPNIVENLFAAAPVLAERTRIREEESRQYQIDEARRRKEEEKRKLEANRWSKFLKLSRQWEDSKVAREFLSVLKDGQFDPVTVVKGRSIADWLNWVQMATEAHDPLKNGTKGVFELVGEVDTWTYRD